MIEFTASLAGILMGATGTVVVSTTVLVLIEAIFGPPLEAHSQKKPVY